jgi:hypothetical protein
LNHTFSLFCFVYYGVGGGSQELFAQAGLEPCSSSCQTPK